MIIAQTKDVDALLRMKKALALQLRRYEDTHRMIRQVEESNVHISEMGVLFVEINVRLEELGVVDEDN